MAHGHQGKGRKFRQLDRSAAPLSPLEPRRLFCGVCQAGDLGTFDPITNFVPTSSFVPAADVSYSPLSSVPALHSHPSSTVKVYLDFTGAAAMTWGSYSVPATPAYDTDGDPTTFSSAELANIQQIWSRVSEKYSPFNVDVTTVDPGSYGQGQAVRAVIGGAGAWLGSPAGGVSYVAGFSFGLSGSPYGSFANDTTVFSFPDNLGGGDPKYTAEATAHEIGHNFGLQHQSTYSGTSKTNEYNPGTGASAPIMGDSYYSTRGLWWKGQNSLSSTTIQDDLSVISSTLNGFGYRADDYGSSADAASPLTLDPSDMVSVSASGVIEKTSDQDWFSFETGAGTVNFTLSMAPYGGMLDGAMKITSGDGSIVYATANTASLGETLSANLLEGTYRVEVYSHGNYGDIGQYTLSGTVVQADPNFVAAPTNLAATRAATGVQLTWTDRSITETGYKVERTGDGGQTWSTVDDTLPADTSSYIDTTAAVGNTYGYRVSAYNDNATSLVTSTVTIAVVPTPPQNLVVSGVTATQLSLAWDAVTDAAGYKIEKSVNNGAAWVLVTTLDSATTTYTATGLTAASKYLFRVKATSGAGDSAPSSSASATTVPAAPPALAAAAVSASQINLTWTRVTGALNYKIDRSTDGGGTWAEVATVSSTLGTYADSALSAATGYSYRVRATDAGGSSAASVTVTKYTLQATPSGLAAALDANSPSVNLSWNAVAGATGYTLEFEGGAATKWTVITTTDANTTSFAHGNLLGGTTYKYTVIALAPTGNSLGAAAVSVLTRPSAPTTLAAVPVGPTQVNLSWTNVGGETGYRLERSGDGGGTWTLVATTAANIAACANAGLTANTAYSYRVRAYNASGESANTSVVSATTLLPAPTGVTTSVTSASVIHVAWSDQSGENGFKIERALGTSGAFTVVGTVAGGVTGYDVTGLAGGTGYTFRVRALNAGGASAPSAAVAGTTKPAAPGVFIATAVAPTQINLAWSKSVGATGYKVDRSDDGGGSWTQLAVLGPTVVAYYDKTAIQDTTSTYRVRAFNVSGDADPSTTAAATPTAGLAVRAPTNLIASVTGIFGQLKLTWIDNANNETRFTIQRSGDGGNTWADLATTAANVTSFIDAKVARGTAYAYRVLAADLWYASAYSNTASATTVSAEVSGFRETAATTTSVTLSWNNVVGETGYRIEQLIGTTWTAVATPGADTTTATISNLTAGTTYPLRIKSLNGSGESAFSAVVNAVTIPPAPSGVVATAVAPTVVTLAWNATAGATAYRVERSADGGTSWALLTTTAATVRSYTNTALTTGTSYQYRVSAFNAAGISSASTPSSATPSSSLAVQPPSSINVSLASGGTHIALSWTNVSANATGVAIQRAPAGTSLFATIARLAAGTTAYTDSAVAAGASYVYRLFSTNAYMTSAASATTTAALTVPAPVAGLRLFAANTASSVSLAWKDVAAETGYTVEYSTDNANWTTAGTTSANVLYYVVTGLSASTRYYFRVRSTNGAGDSLVGIVLYTSTANASGSLTAAGLPANSSSTATSEAGPQPGPTAPASTAPASPAASRPAVPAPVTPFSAVPVLFAPQPISSLSLWDRLLAEAA